MLASLFLVDNSQVGEGVMMAEVEAMMMTTMIMLLEK